MAYVHRAEGTSQRGVPGAAEPDNVLRFTRSDRPLIQDPSPIALAQLIEAEIIPRLLAAHQGGDRSDVIPMNTGIISPAELERFARQSFVEDLGQLMEHVDLFMRRGVAVETIYFDLLSPAAKLLGEMWEDDQCTFADVTVGLCRLQQIIYEFADRVHVENGGGRRSYGTVCPDAGRPALAGPDHGRRVLPSVRLAHDLHAGRHGRGSGPYGRDREFRPDRFLHGQ